MALQAKAEFYRRWRHATLTSAMRRTGIVNLVIGTLLTFVVWKWPAAGALGATLRWLIPTLAFSCLLILRSARSAFDLFHEVDAVREAAEDELREKRKCQAIADYLTEQYHYGVHNLLHQPPTNQAELAQWNQWVGNWNEAIRLKLNGFNCSPQDIDFFITIKQDNLSAQELATAIGINTGLHRLRLDRVQVLARKYADRAEQLMFRCPEIA